MIQNLRKTGCFCNACNACLLACFDYKCCSLKRTIYQLERSTETLASCKSQIYLRGRDDNEDTPLSLHEILWRSHFLDFCSAYFQMVALFLSRNFTKPNLTVLFYNFYFGNPLVIHTVTLKWGPARFLHDRCHPCDVFLAGTLIFLQHGSQTHSRYSFSRCQTLPLL